MTQSPDFHRHPDGSLDFDFYKRRAARQRRRMRQLVFRRYLRTMVRAGMATVTAIRTLMRVGSDAGGELGGYRRKALS